MKVLIVVTHLLGTGHLSRALTLARAFVDDGHKVQVASGGMPAPQLNSDGLEIVQLPPLRSDGVNFIRLLDEAGNLAGADVYSARQSRLEVTLHSFQPDVLITELFPFGRRSLRDEFTAILTTAHAFAKPPLVLSSIRDILAPPSKPAKAQFGDDVISELYDGVLVHSDQSVTPIDLSWPVSDMLREKLHYTGFVAPAASLPHPQKAGEGEVLISAGGGDVGGALFHAAKAAARHDPNRIWRILVGGQDRAARIAELLSDAPENLVVEAARPDFRSMLNHAAASVSMCGYNTALDVLQTGVPSVFVPFDAGGEVEQSLRARALAAHKSITVLPDAELSADTLLEAVQGVILSGPRLPARTGFDGAAETVRIVKGLLGDD